MSSSRCGVRPLSSASARGIVAAFAGVFTACAPVDDTAAVAGIEPLRAAAPRPVSELPLGPAAWDQSLRGLAYVASRDGYVAVFADDRFHDPTRPTEHDHVRIAQTTWQGERIDGTEAPLPIASLPSEGDLACGWDSCAFVWVDDDGLSVLRIRASDMTPIDASPVLLASGDVRSPQVACSGTDFLVVHERGLPGASDIVSVRVPASGPPGTPTLLAGSMEDEVTPRIACGPAGGCGVGWTVPGFAAFGAGGRLVMVSAAGVPTGAVAARIAGERLHELAFASPSAIVAATQDGADVLLVRTFSVAGTALRTGASRAIATTGARSPVQLACSSAGACAVAAVYGGVRYVSRFPASLTSATSHHRLDAGDVTGLALAADPYGHFVAGIEARVGARDLSVARLAPGARDFTPASPLTQVTVDQLRPRAVGVPGLGFGVAWFSGAGGRGDLVFRVLDPRGEPVTSEVTVSRGIWTSTGMCSWGTDPRSVDLAWDGTGFVLVWSEEDGCGAANVFVARLDRNAKLVEPARSLTLASGGNALNPAIACMPGDCLVAFTHIGLAVGIGTILVGTRSGLTASPMSLVSTEFGLHPRVAVSVRGYELAWNTVSEAEVRVVSVSGSGAATPGSDRAIGRGLLPEIACVDDRCIVAAQADDTSASSSWVRTYDGGTWGAPRVVSAAQAPTVAPLAADWALTFVRPGLGIAADRGAVMMTTVPSSGPIGLPIALTSRREDGHAHVASDGTSALVVWDRLSFAAGKRSAHSSLVGH
jgi:hypothetical protein